MTNFSLISPVYRQHATLQRSAGDALFDLLALQPGERVLDLGCGPGNLTRRIWDLTGSTVTGIDPSEGMIAEARKTCAEQDAVFEVCPVESLAATGAFDAIFCNSAFQWFRDPACALSNCFRALVPGGRLGIQAPATRDYCPNFVRAFDALATDDRTVKAYAHFQSPWLFLETAEAYANCSGRRALSSTRRVLKHRPGTSRPKRSSRCFESGAAGWLSQSRAL